MIGITGCGYHVPFCRLERAHFAQAWNRRVGKGERAAIYFDEDALTLGFEAAQRCLEYTGNKKVDALFFASTSAPFWQRSAASFLAAACDLSAACETSDFGGSLRSATAALRAGVDALNSRRLSTLLISVGEVRDGQPGETEEEWFGDAGSALTLGRENVLAEIMGLATHSSDFWDEWRRDGDEFIRTQASRFSTERGYQKNLVAVGKALLEKHGVPAQQVAKVILPSPDGRAHSATARHLGFQDAQLLDPCFGEIGAPGSAAPFLLLAAALEGANPGDLLLLLNYGDGADGVLLRVTEAIRKRRFRPRSLTISARNGCIPPTRFFRKCAPTISTTRRRPSCPTSSWKKKRARTFVCTARCVCAVERANTPSPQSAADARTATPSTKSRSNTRAGFLPLPATICMWLPTLRPL